MNRNYCQIVSIIVELMGDYKANKLCRADVTLNMVSSSMAPMFFISLVLSMVLI